MTEMEDNEGYGNCDEVAGNDGCAGCKGCDVPSADRRQHMLADVDQGDTKTQPIRIRVTDLAQLQALQQFTDETPGGVIHRILQERAEPYAGGEFDSDTDVMEKYERIIGKQKEKISTLQREIEEQKRITTVIKTAVNDSNENDGESVKGYMERLAEVSKQRDELVETVRNNAAELHAVINDRNVRILQLEYELGDTADADSDTICAGQGTTININIFGGSPTGV